MAENEFWNNLDNFVEQNKNSECVGNWLSNIPDISKTEGCDMKISEISIKNFSKTDLLLSTKTISSKKKRLVNTKKMKNKNVKPIAKRVNNTKKIYVRRLKLRRRRRSCRNKGLKYFGPQVECK